AAHEWADAPAGRKPVLRFEVNGRWPFISPLVGLHNAGNALAAIAVARRLGVDDEHIAMALATAAGPEMRWDRQIIGGVEVINDAYNANPDSSAAAIRTFTDLYPAGQTPGRRIIVIGDMLELGPLGEPAHAELGQSLAPVNPCDRLITIGALAANMA